MGFYAYGSGTALLKDNIKKEELFGRLDEKVSDAYRLDYEYDGKETIDITDSENYSEEDIMDFLNILSPYITEGAIEYTGGDDYHWKFVFDKENEEWDEIEGEVYYSLDEFSDEVLIEELKSRGYEVTVPPVEAR